MSALKSLNQTKRVRLTDRIVAGLLLASMIAPGAVFADDHGGGHDHGGSKPKIIFHVGPVTKTPDPKGQQGGGKDGHH